MKTFAIIITMNTLKQRFANIVHKQNVPNNGNAAIGVHVSTILTQGFVAINGGVELKHSNLKNQNCVERRINYEYSSNRRN